MIFLSNIRNFIPQIYFEIFGSIVDIFKHLTILIARYVPEIRGPGQFSNLPIGRSGTALSHHRTSSEILSI
jgi:hypothetical protein